MKSPSENSEVKILPKANKFTKIHEGLPTLKPAPVRVKPRTEFTVKYLKLHAITRTCPIHGRTMVMSRSPFSYDSFSTLEGLACGHTLMISRVTKANRFIAWRLIFKETIKAS